MRYLLLILVAYFVVRSVGKMLSNLKIVDTDPDQVKGQTDDKQSHLRVDEADIEDAEFKDVE